MDPVTDAGWYSDPTDADQLRWFDGAAWTDHVHPMTPVMSDQGTDAVPSPPSAVVALQAAAHLVGEARVGAPSTVAQPASPDTRLHSEGVKELTTGILIIAGGVGLALVIGEITSAASEAAGGGGGGVRVWSLPIFLVGLVRVVTGVGKLGRASATPAVLQDLRVAIPLPAHEAAARSASLLSSHGAVVTDQREASVIGYVSDDAGQHPFTLTFSPASGGCVGTGDGAGRGDKAVRWALAQLGGTG